MSMLMNAPEYNEAREKRTRNIAIGSVVLVLATAVLAVSGFLTGHGWFFSNIPVEHKVDHFFTALENKDYAKAYGIYEGDSDWQKHPEKFSYSLQRFTEDWTTYSPVDGPITSHHVDISKTDGTGTFGSGVIVAVRLNGRPKDKATFMYYVRSDGTLTWPSHHILEY